MRLDKLRKLLKRNNGWVSGGSYTITVPKGEWVIGQKITLENSKLNAEPPTLKMKNSPSNNKVSAAPIVYTKPSKKNTKIINKLIKDFLPALKSLARK